MKSKKLSRLLINFFARCCPAFSGHLSYQEWTSTYRRPPSKEECEWYNKANHHSVHVRNNKIDCCYFGEGPRVLLLHGWNGRGLQLCAFIQPLLDAGFSIATFDSPGHGRSTGSHANVLEIAEVIITVEKQLGPFDVIVSHSFGVLAAANALRLGVKCNVFIGISCCADFHWLLDFYSKRLGLSDQARQALNHYTEKQYHIDSLDEISITQIAPALSLPALIIHDREDDRVPVTEASRIVDSWPGAELLTTRGLGHVKIIQNADVVRHCVAFIKAIRHRNKI